MEVGSWPCFADVRKPLRASRTASGRGASPLSAGLPCSEPRTRLGGQHRDTPRIMNRPTLRFRQVHLDFHTSPHIPAIGAAFDKAEWQETLRRAQVDSITLFAKCHHGWSYHPTTVGRMHPGLSFDLLRAQFEATKEIGVNAPIYISAGLDDVAAEEHPEWRQIDAEGRYDGWSKTLLEPGFRHLDFLSPYLDYLCAQIEEVVELFPGCDGIFLDIIHQRPGASPWRMRWMAEHDLDPCSEAARLRCAGEAHRLYYERTTAAVKRGDPDRPVFHNSGHIAMGEREKYETWFSHLELESLPTGGWGYDHFPLSLKYVENLPHSVLGMTGKFHTTWGEFGGFKHPNALRYECAAMIAFGARCSVGDQLHPSGRLDASTYRVIGQAYAGVAAREAWCAGAVNCADIAVLAAAATPLDPVARAKAGRTHPADTGVARMFLEEKLLFTLLDHDRDFSAYPLVVLPDEIPVDAGLAERLAAHLGRGGRVLLTGASGLRPDGSGPALDLGADWSGESPFVPSFILPNPDLRPDWLETPMVMYGRSQRLQPTSGESLGDVFEPYFNRNYAHYCSHQHAPPRPEPSGYAFGVRRGGLAALAYPVFSDYAAHGTVALREITARVIRSLLGEDIRLVLDGLPSSGRANLAYQGGQHRHVLHLLYGQPIRRGGEGGGRGAIEVIEDLPSAPPVQVTLRLAEPVRSVRLEPEGRTLEFRQAEEVVRFTVPAFTCHALIVVQH
ncbi:MAG: hypothetical protein EA425_05805 [Puniceicoccaceae bacterium]|nr:MAG: hypothetical protein EA425_05805 [Puniceicoccaceae bacterium]